MFGKVLLLALVCVAATEVRGIDLKLGTEEALNQAGIIFEKLGESIHYAVEVYSEGSFGFFKICETYWGIVWDYADDELVEIDSASAEVTRMAKEKNSPESVFTCISEKTQEANEILRVMPWSFDRRLQGEAERFRNDHYKIVNIAYEYMKTYRDDYWGNIVKSLKECDSQECLEEILNKYEDEYKQKSEVLGEVINKLDAHAEEFKVLAETMLSAVKDSFTFARIAGVNEIKKCLTMSQ